MKKCKVYVQFLPGIIEGLCDMKRRQSCPVCGTENDLEYYTEEVGLVESHYYCDKCGFAEEMTYSPVMMTFCDTPKNFFRHEVTRLKHWKKALIIRLSDDFSFGLGFVL